MWPPLCGLMLPAHPPLELSLTWVGTHNDYPLMRSHSVFSAPEVVQPPSRGYRFAVDWWSLGVSAYEMLRGHRPFAMERNMSTTALYNLLTQTRPSASVNWDTNTCDVLKMVRLRCASADLGILVVCVCVRIAVAAS